MRLPSWFAIMRCYGLNGFSSASHSTIAKESEQLNIQMSSKRAHFEKEIGLCILGYKAEFHQAIKREVQKTFHKQQKGERKMAEETNNSQKVQTIDVETEKIEPEITGTFQKTIDSIQLLIGENEQKLDDLNKSFSAKDKERDELSKIINEMSEKLKKINEELGVQIVQIDAIGEGMEHLLIAQEAFKKTK